MVTFSRILCLFGRHMRSRGHARHTAEGWRSRCRRCGAPMLRGDDEGPWRVDEAAATSARRGREPARAHGG